MNAFEKLNSFSGTRSPCKAPQPVKLAIALKFNVLFFLKCSIRSRASARAQVASNAIVCAVVAVRFDLVSSSL